MTVARNSRTVSDWTPERVDASAVAPHRYTWDSDREYQPALHAVGMDALDAFRATIPYTAGDVVYEAVDGRAVRARIVRVFTERLRDGDRVAKYRVQRETAAGTWSKLWVYTWAGFIQRGYQLAGLAPDIPTDNQRVQA